MEARGVKRKPKVFVAFGVTMSARCQRGSWRYFHALVTTSSGHTFLTRLNSAARLFEKVASGLRISSCKTNHFCNLKFVASGWATSRPEVSKENQRWYKWIKGAPSERKNRARGTEISSCRAKPFCNLKLVSSRQAKWRSVASEETQRTHKWATSEPKVPKDSKIVNSHWARANCQH